MSKRILLVEDGPGVRVALTDRLQYEGYVVETATDRIDGVARATAEPFDLVVLDVMLPGKNALDVCRDLREKGVDSPIVMLSACRQLADRVMGLKLGADDYVTKPFDLAELLVRIEARLRRRPEIAPPAATQKYRFSAIEVDFRSAEVRRHDRLLELSAKEYRLLRYFIQHRGATLSRDELLNNVWGYDAMPTTRTVDTHVAWLRRKIEPNRHHPQFILTIHGLGYKFVG